LLPVAECYLPKLVQVHKGPLSKITHKSQASASPHKYKSGKLKTYRIPKSTLKGPIIINPVNKELEKEIGIILLNNYRDIKMYL
jgi:hypothetical protein